MTNPKISIVVPVYNVGKYLARCLDSIIAQTLQEIEIICVNDFSNDHSQSILDHYAEKEVRMAVVRHSSNQGILMTRKSGVNIASGKYILFVDSDDSIEPQMCEVLYRTMENERVDICHFPANVIPFPTITELNEIHEFVRPYCIKLKDDEVFTSCFINSDYRWTLWNKIYKTGLCKKAYEAAGNFYCNMADDVYIYFILSYFASSYLGIACPPLYNYHYGLGMTGGRQKSSLVNLTVLCNQSMIISELRAFLLRQHAPDRYHNSLMPLEKRFFDHCMWYWYKDLAIADSSQGFDILSKTWGSENVIAFLAKNHFYQQQHIAQKILGSTALKIKKDKISKIGVFYHRMHNGGVERVISLLIPVWIELGYSVVLFTDEEPTGIDFPLPVCVDRVVLPTSLCILPGDAPERISALRKGILSFDIDLFIHNASSSPMLLYDLLAIKTVGIPTIVSSHECFSSSMFWRDAGLWNKVHVYKIADLVVVLTQVDQKFWTIFGIETVLIPNPLFLDINEIRQSRLDSQNVIWVGRFAIEKQYVDPVHIFAEVVRIVPQARLLMVGKGESQVQTDFLNAEIKRLGLENNVELCGYHTDISRFYAISSVYLTTSYHESFSMALIESRASGIPTVAYDLPNLDILYDSQGAVIVPQGDKSAAADAIVTLLYDQELKIKMGHEARLSSELFYATNNVRDQWKTVFNQILLTEKQSFAVPDDPSEIYRRMFQSILLHYKLGLTANYDWLSQNTRSLPGPLHNRDTRTDTGNSSVEPVSNETLLAIENLTDHPEYVKYYQDSKMILVHPVSDVPSLCRMKNACPKGTVQIHAEVETSNKRAQPVDYAIIVSSDNHPQWQKKLQRFEKGVCSGWVTVPGLGSSVVRLELDAPLESAAHLYLATRIKPGVNNNYCWAHFRNIRLTRQ